jgi:uncharacterized protein
MHTGKLQDEMHNLCRIFAIFRVEISDKMQNTRPMLMELSYTAWMIAVSAALLVGLGKGGLPGTGNLSVVLMAMVFPSKESVAILLPILICADIVAVRIYHQHAQWHHLLRLLPWTLAGIALGAFVFVLIPEAILTRTIGGILLLMVALTPLRHRFQVQDTEASDSTVPLSLATRTFIGSTGILGGVATMVANAAGPVIGIYLLLSRLPKFAFIGTSAWFFFLINLTKLPIQIGIGNLQWGALRYSIPLGIVAAGAAALAPKIVQHIPQKGFNLLIWFFVIVAGVKMLLT